MGNYVKYYNYIIQYSSIIDLGLLRNIMWLNNYKYKFLSFDLNLYNDIIFYNIYKKWLLAIYKYR